MSGHIKRRSTKLEGERIMMKYMENQVGKTKAITNSRKKNKSYRKRNQKTVQNSASNNTHIVLVMKTLNSIYIVIII